MSFVRSSSSDEENQDNNSSGEYQTISDNINDEANNIIQDKQSFKIFSKSSHQKPKNYETIELTHYSNFAAPSNPKKESWTLSNFIPKLLFGNAINRAYVNRKFNNALAYCGLVTLIDLPPQAQRELSYFDDTQDQDQTHKKTCKEKCGSCISGSAIGLVSFAVNIPGSFLTWNSIDKNHNLEAISKSFIAWIKGESAKSWWSYPSTSNQQRYELIAKFSSFLSVNTLLNWLYFPEAIAKFKTSIQECHAILNAIENGKRKYSLHYRTWKVTKLIISAILALAGSISAAGMSYMSLSWTNPAIYIISMGISSLSFLLIRFVGSINVLTIPERLTLWLFHHGIKPLINLLDRFKYADQKTQEILEKILRNEIKIFLKLENNKSKKQVTELNESEFETLTLTFLNQIKTALQENKLDLSEEKPTSASIKDYAFMLSSLTLAGYFAYEVSPIFGQMTINGLNGFAKAAGYSNGITAWGHNNRLAVGIVGILPNFNTYLDAIRKLPYTLANTFWRAEETISENGILSSAFIKEGGLLALLAYFNYYAGFGLAGTATSIEGNPNDFGLKTDGNGIVITAACGAAAASVNVNSNLNRLEQWLKKKENITLLNQFITRWEEYEKRQPNDAIIKEMKDILASLKEFVTKTPSHQSIPISNNRNGFFAGCCEPNPEREPLNQHRSVIEV